MPEHDDVVCDQFDRVFLHLRQFGAGNQVRQRTNKNVCQPDLVLQDFFLPVRGESFCLLIDEQDVIPHSVTNEEVFTDHRCQDIPSPGNLVKRIGNAVFDFGMDGITHQVEHILF